MKLNFQQKPVKIEAFKFTKELALESFVEKKLLPFGLQVTGSWHPINKVVHYARVRVDNFGEVYAQLDDWIIKHSSGRLSINDDATFKKLYEQILE